MRFHVGPHLYSLTITAGPLIHEGEHCDSACLASTREILIANAAPVRDRLRLLSRELVNAWLFATGEPRNRAGWADLFATAMVATLTDLATCGGELALLGLRSGESPEPAAARIGLSSNRQCATCGGTISGGSVAWRLVAPGVAELLAYCEFCDRTMVWREATNARGMPSAIVVGQPTFVRGDASGAAVRECQSLDV